MLGVSKRYAGVRALDDASLTVRAGEVHALLGENGAGKSTLMKILAGAVERDAGEIRLDGEPVDIGSRQDATAAGVGIVFQHAELIDELSVADNVTIGREASRLGFIDRREARRRTEHALQRLGSAVPAGRVVRGLRAGERQLVEIARAIAYDVRVLVLDEPTASLGEQEAENLFRILRELRDAGIAIVYISHRLPEIFTLADRITVMRDGRTIATRDVASTSREELIRLMVGRDLSSLDRRGGRRRGPVVLHARGLVSGGGLRGADLTLHEGEVLGVYGLLGSGRTELARAIIGADPVVAGSLELQGRAGRLSSPSRAVREGVGIVPEERISQGTFQGLSVRENVTAARGELISRHGWVQPRRERRRAAEVVERLAIRTSSIEAPVATLSGGNQQKVVFGRWLHGDLRVLILDDPTVGVDVGAKDEIYAIIADLAARGTAILLLSSELPELLGLADRLVVMREGRTVGELAGPQMTEQAALDHALGAAG